MEPAKPMRSTKSPFPGGGVGRLVGKAMAARYGQGSGLTLALGAQAAAPQGEEEESHVLGRRCGGRPLRRHRGIDCMLNPELGAERRVRMVLTLLMIDVIRIEPFNLERKREEGYFDENGNFVEYARGNEIKDAWLDSVEVDPTYAANVQNKGNGKVEEFEDLLVDDIVLTQN
uniref:Uncharacterized protein n=1 Tax=Setaria viridis TaxID=4556 RepID=A0A4U6VV96_SETVI|nr:LOW QUALITY PROTEIN: hypothetical protein SEVIR_2G197600v2 [Setaria viridis]